MHVQHFCTLEPAYVVHIYKCGPEIAVGVGPGVTGAVLLAARVAQDVVVDRRDALDAVASEIVS